VTVHNTSLRPVRADRDDPCTNSVHHTARSPARGSIVALCTPRTVRVTLARVEHGRDREEQSDQKRERSDAEAHAGEDRMESQRERQDPGRERRESQQPRAQHGERKSGREDGDHPAAMMHRRRVGFDLDRAHGNEDDQPWPPGTAPSCEVRRTRARYWPVKALAHDAEIGAVVESLKKSIEVFFALTRQLTPNPAISLWSCGMQPAYAATSLRTPAT
jgi:hypothetical protein